MSSYLSSSNHTVLSTTEVLKNRLLNEEVPKPRLWEGTFYLKDAFPDIDFLKARPYIDPHPVTTLGCYLNPEKEYKNNYYEFDFLGPLDEVYYLNTYAAIVKKTKSSGSDEVVWVDFEIEYTTYQHNFEFLIEQGVVVDVEVLNGTNNLSKSFSWFQTGNKVILSYLPSEEDKYLTHNKDFTKFLPDCEVQIKYSSHEISVNEGGLYLSSPTFYIDAVDSIKETARDIELTTSNNLKLNSTSEIDIKSNSTIDLNALAISLTGVLSKNVIKVSGNTPFEYTSLICYRDSSSWYVKVAEKGASLSYDSYIIMKLTGIPTN